MVSACGALACTTSNQVMYLEGLLFPFAEFEETICKSFSSFIEVSDNDFGWSRPEPRKNA